MRRVPLLAAGTAVVAISLAACGSSSTSSSSSSASASSASSSSSASASGSASTSSAASGSITVFAASSLKESFTTIGKAFEAANPGTTVNFSFAASSALATQIVSGAPADVFASASTKTMDLVVTAKDASSPTVFAKNIMEIATPPSNPANITSISDLSKPGVKVALCQPQVPCGTSAVKVLAKAKVVFKPVSLEPDVKAVLSKVTLGEVDAGMVYVTDVQAAGDKVKGVTIPSDINASTSYPIAALDKSTNAATAKAFVDYVLSPEGAAVLTAAGFEKP